MRVLYDITTLGNIHCAPGVNGSGIYRATEDLAMALLERDDVDLSWSAAPGQHAKALRYLREAGRLPLGRYAFPGGSDRRSQLMASAYSPLVRQSSELRGGLDDAYTARSYDPASIYNGGGFDVYHANWRAETTLPDRACPAVLLTVFDIIALKRPEWFVEPGAANSIGEYLEHVITSVGSRHAIVVNTESVKQDILERFAMVSDEQIFVVPLGVGDRISKCDDTDRIDTVRRRYGIPDDHRYVLCVNTIEPRKNMVSAIQAFVELKRSLDSDDVSLVLAGSNGWLFDDIVAHSDDASAVHGASIVMTGYVAEEDLSALYSGASCFCYPSLDEGFGLPVLEAMKCAVPVVTSRRAPLQEVAGDSALYAEPTDTAELATAMHSILSDADTAASLGARGVERAAAFSWQRSADHMADTYRQISDDRVRRRGGVGPTSPSERARIQLRDQLTSAVAGDGIDALRGVFADQTVFVLGDSPDLRRAPLSLLGEKITIALNGSYTRLEGQPWKPTVYLVDADDLETTEAEEINGLTGSTFVFSSRIAGELRTGGDVVGLDPDDERLIDDSSLAGADLNELSGPARSMLTAIRLAEYLGAVDIVLIEPEVDVTWSGHRPSSGSNRADVVDMLSAAGERSRGETPASLHVLSSTDLEVPLHRLSTEKTLFDRGMKEHERSDHAHLDETEALAAFFPDDGRQRIMIDVGAHRGTSAIFFVDRPWTIHCFEPDSHNRGHLERRLGDRSNLTIDPRAVGAEPATAVDFFTSDESSGISGLSAFRPTHRSDATVEVTTLTEVVRARAIEHIDFLKIDVEGFDFDVLRGVPWDDVRPDVIECEYEDAKTIPLGHSWRDIADFLVGKGYSVYVSEWHPIIRYGTAHDWRRVVPYPGIDVPSNSWGNLIAFKRDPGLAVVNELFERHVTHRPSGADTVPAHVSTSSAPTAATPATTASVEQRGPRKEQQVTRRRWYADRADRLRARVPRLYWAVRRAYRASRSRLARRAAAVAALVLLAGLIVVAALDIGPAWRAGIVAAIVVLMLAAGVAVLGLYVRRAARNVERVARANRKLRADLVGVARRANARIFQLESRADEAERRFVANADLLEGMLDRLDSVHSSVAEQHGRIERAEQSLTTKPNGQAFVELSRDFRGSVSRLDELSSAVNDQARNTGASVEALDSRLRRVENRADRSNYSNSPDVRIPERRLRNEDVEAVREHWIDHLGLTLNDRELRYMAHKICLDEERCEGRLATTIQAAVLRSLALLSLGGSHIQVLEIGTLSGIGAGSLFNVARRAGKVAEFTLIDPLSGYYGSGIVDRQTGVAISATTLHDNLSALGMTESDYRVIQRRSDDPAAVEAAADRTYDLVLIDGDHSLQGVATDFDLYGSMVKPGGLLIFDDYDTEDWPAIKPFVDDEVRSRPDWLWVGGQWRTGILQRRHVTTT